MMSRDTEAFFEQLKRQSNHTRTPRVYREPPSFVKQKTPSLAISSNPFDELDDDDEDDIDTRTHSNNGEAIAEDMEQRWRDLQDLISTMVADTFTLQEFKEHLEALFTLIERDQLASGSNTSACLELFLSENVLEKVYLFTTRQRSFSRDVRIILLQFCTRLLSIPGPPLLIHQQVLRPMSRLLRACEMLPEQDLAASVVPLLQQICLLIQEHESLLDLFYVDGEGQKPSKFLIFTQLVPHMHNSKEEGKRSRDAMLVCLFIAARSPLSHLGEFIVADTSFCQVLATGLSAIYSELPTSVELITDEWESPLSSIDHVPQLRRFLQALAFCNSVLQMAPAVVCKGVVSLVRNGFLQQVLGPALLQTSEDSAAVAVGYLIVFLTNITNPLLMREFLQFLTIGSCDTKPILNCLIQYIASSNDKLPAMALELFHLLLNLNCEDFLLETILKYLMPGDHVMPTQIPVLGNPDMYGQSARRLLQLVPEACNKAERRYLDSLAQRAKSPTHSSRGSSPTPIDHQSSNDNSHKTGDTVSLSATAQEENRVPSPNHPHRVRRGSTSSTCSSVSAASLQSTLQMMSNGVPSSDGSSLVYPSADVVSNIFELIPEEMGYLNYLAEARAAIKQCAEACICWSSTYDRCIVTDFASSHDINHATKPATNDSSGPQVNVQSPDGLSVPIDTLPSVVDSQASPMVSPTSSPSVVRRRSLRRHSESLHDRFTDRVGLLLKVLLERLAKILNNQPVINLLLTRVITRLVYYPQPLLCSLLLNHQLVLKPGVPNLFFVIQGITDTIDSLVKERENFDYRLGRARKTMIYKAAVKCGNVKEDSTPRSGSLKMLVKTNSCLSDLGDQETPIQDAVAPQGERMRRRAYTEGGKSMAALKRKKKQYKVTASSLYAIIIFGEFVKELSAVSLEHSTANPQYLHDHSAHSISEV